MKISTSKTLFIAAFLTAATINAQNISAEKISFSLLQEPKIILPANSRTFAVNFKSPYNLTAEDVIKKSKMDFEEQQANYDHVVAESKVKYQERLKEYEADVKKAKDDFATETAGFKKLSLIERLALTDQGRNPKLRIVDKPIYSKPLPPVYKEPNLSEYFIVDDKVLASQIKIDGYTKGNPNVDINVDMAQVNFQDNAGQTHANQPTKLVIKVNGKEEVNETLFTEYEFISSSPSDNINKPAEEKTYLLKNVKALNKIINNYFGYQAINKEIQLDNVKNKGQYDDLAKAHIYISTNLKKLQANPDTSTDVALANMQKGIDIWNDALKKINYKDSKADYNSKIARYIYFNLIKVNLALGNKTEAEKYLNQLQENLVYIKLDSYEKQQLDILEKEIYKRK